MFISANPVVIVAHIAAMVLFVLAAKGIGVRYTERRGRWHLAWLAMALLMAVMVLADFGVLKA